MVSDFMDERFGDLDNSFTVAEYFLTNAAIGYQRDNWRAGLNFRNLFGIEMRDRLSIVSACQVAAKKGVKSCFETYQQDVVKRMNEDIAARKTELNDLIKQKESHEIDREGEIQRLNQLDDEVLAQSHQVADAYDQVLGIHVPEVASDLEVEPVADSVPVAEDTGTNQQEMLIATAV
ncbi:MAG: TonB-dependent receptor [Cyanobacteria bacterium P01_C01_bin.147]